MDAITKQRGAILIEDLVELRIVWLSIDPSDQSQPDIDNMLKPLIDAFNKRIIVDDRQVHRIVAEKAPINSPPNLVLDVMDEIQDDERFLMTGEVIVIRLLDFDRELRP